MIKAVIFDLGKVIVPFDFKRGYAKLEPLCGVPADEIPSRIWQTDLVQRFERGEIEPEPFVEELAGHLAMKVEYPAFCEIWNSIFFPETLIPESMLIRLAKDYKLVLLSNTNRIHFEGIQAQYPHIGHFHELVLSYRVGAMKPDPKIYQAAIAAAGCRPHECFFTDDIPEYVEGARREGIDAVRFQSAGQIQNESLCRGGTHTNENTGQCEVS